MSSRKAILEKVMADRLRAMGEGPDAEKLVQWRQGTLTEQEREAWLERAAVDPAFARQLLDGLDFPEVPTEQPWDEATRERKWQRFTDRLREEGARADGPATEPLAFPAPVADRATRWLRLAASLFIGVLLGVALYRVVDGPTSQAPAVRNVESLALIFDDATGGRGSSTEIKASAEWVQLTFSSASLPVAESYSLRVLDTGGAEVFRQAGLVPGTGAKLTALLPASRLPAGGYQALIYPGDDFDAEALATATWIVTLGS